MAYTPKDYKAYMEVRSNLLRQIKLSPEMAVPLGNALLFLDYQNDQLMRNELTGMPNSRQRAVDLETVLAPDERRKSRNTRLYVAMLDIDNFGKFNKTHGEHIGNKVLQITSGILMDAVREYDTLDERFDHKADEKPVARAYHLHGEEKQIVFDAPDDATAFKIADRYRQMIQEKSQELGSPEPITETIGVTVWDYDKEKFEKAQQRADANMQEAKRLGKNRVLLKNLDSTQLTIPDADLAKKHVA